MEKSESTPRTNFRSLPMMRYEIPIILATGGDKENGQCPQEPGHYFKFSSLRSMKKGSTLNKRSNPGLFLTLHSLRICGLIKTTFFEIK